LAPEGRSGVPWGAQRHQNGAQECQNDSQGSRNLGLGTKIVLKISATNGTIYKSSPPKIIHHQTIPPHHHPQIASAVAGLGISQWIFHETYTTVVHSKGNKSSIHQPGKWKIHPADLFGNVLPTKSLCLPKT